MNTHTGTPSPTQPFSIADTLRACEGTVDRDTLHTSPLRVLVRNAKGIYEPVPYNGQPYMAISYCWPGGSFLKIGTSNEPTPVQTSNGIVQSQHFSRFISRAAESWHASLAVWIDYHCINQDDVEEKTAQVAIMQHIYTKAQITLVMLEDKALSAQEQLAVTRPQVRTDPTSAARSVLSARWFSRAWCSQELVLSHKVQIYTHSQEGDPADFPADLFWHCVEKARYRDPSIPVFREPRGRLPDVTVAKTSCVWALAVVHRLGCSDEYDKAALVCNLVRLVYRFSSRPTAFNVHSPAIHLNVLKMINVIALQRRDFSLLLANHGTENPLRGQYGFGWAGEPIEGDRCSELWKKEDYQGDRDPDIALHNTGLVARGCLARISAEHTWEIRRDGPCLRLNLNGVSHVVTTTDTASHASWTWTYDARQLRDLMLALAFASTAGDNDTSHHARIVFAYLLEEDYERQPGRPGSSDADIAAAMGFIWREPSRAVFRTVATEDGSVFLVGGNASGLAGRLLFQPYVVRPRLFSSPILLTANSMILDNDPSTMGTHRCMGCVRGLGLIPDSPGYGALTVRIV
ncbi:hypothetical protein FKP32DRAFT_1613301 [Trametes sanguinea]|nr:hypothetical protein FKP32DRAFT_1613301 [Trametes sanguinea]